MQQIGSYVSHSKDPNDGGDDDEPGQAVIEPSKEGTLSATEEKLNNIEVPANIFHEDQVDHKYR